MSSVASNPEIARASNLPPALATTRGDKDAGLKDACTQFEAYFLSHLLKTMRDSIPTDGLVPRSSAEQTFQEMLDNEYASQLSRAKPVGLAALLYQQLTVHGANSSTVDHVG
ncbi:MAG: rod-binding protein [Armatimonadota bacterium]